MAITGARFGVRSVENHHKKAKRNGKPWGDNQVCARCGWHGPCDHHRLDKNKGYVQENVLVLCPNCHRLVTMGLVELGDLETQQDLQATEATPCN